MSQDEIHNAIEVSGLAKSFGELQAVAGVDFTVGSGELFGFLGPNGAGKTTTINMLTGLARPDAGSIRISGIDCSGNPKAAQHLMGIVPDESNLYPELSGFENLCFCGALYGMRRRERESRAEELLKQFGLAEAGGRKFGGYSKGMKRKLTIAAGILHSPPLLFLDEPTSGIDVASARLLRRLVSDLNAAGTTIFLTTHYIEEAERLCGRIAFIVSGRIVRTDTVENLMRGMQNRFVVQLELSGRRNLPVKDLSARFPHLQCRIVSGGVFRIEASEQIQVGPLVRFMEDRGFDVFEARRIHPSLEEIFVQITGIEADVMKLDTGKASVGGPA